MSSEFFILWSVKKTNGISGEPHLIGWIDRRVGRGMRRRGIYAQAIVGLKSTRVLVSSCRVEVYIRHSCRNVLCFGLDGTRNGWNQRLWHIHQSAFREQSTRVREVAWQGRAEIIIKRYWRLDKAPRGLRIFRNLCDDGRSRARLLKSTRKTKARSRQQ